MAALRRLAEYCDYKQSLSEMLRDRLVCGVNNTRIQKALLSESTLTGSSVDEGSGHGDGREERRDFGANHTWRRHLR